ncbi:MAG: hypothetical protein ACK56I_19230, partial [bacterium]
QQHLNGLRAPQHPIQQGIGVPFRQLVGEHHQRGSLLFREGPGFSRGRDCPHQLTPRPASGGHQREHCGIPHAQQQPPPVQQGLDLAVVAGDLIQQGGVVHGPTFPGRPQRPR